MGQDHGASQDRVSRHPIAGQPGFPSRCHRQTGPGCWISVLRSADNQVLLLPSSCCYAPTVLAPAMTDVAVAAGGSYCWNGSQDSSA